MITHPKPKDVAAALHKICVQARGLKHSHQTLAQKLASAADWRDLTPEAQQRRLAEARQKLLDSFEPLRDDARHLAGQVLHGAEERLGVARFFRQAQFSDDPTVNLMTRMCWLLELPKIPNETLGAMARDCMDRGGAESAALLTLIDREFATRGPVGSRGLAAEANVMLATTNFPLPAELAAERAAVAEIARTLDSIESAHAEVAQPPGMHRDRTESRDRIQAGEPPPAPTVIVKPERTLPFMVARDDAPTQQPDDAA